MGPSSSTSGYCVLQFPGPDAEQPVSHGQKASCSEVVSLRLLLHGYLLRLPVPRYHRQNQSPWFSILFFHKPVLYISLVTGPMMVRSVLGPAATAP